MKKQRLVLLALMVLVSLTATSCLKFGSECTCTDDYGTSDIDPSDYGTDDCSEACTIWTRQRYGI